MSCYVVSPTIRHQITALRHLVRPSEVRDLLVPLPPWPPPRGTFATRVAEWLRRKLADGELAYLPDPGFDWWCSPRATRARGGGDCEDLAILAVSLLRAGGVTAQVVVGWYYDGWTTQGHAWVEGADRLGPFFLEATTGQLLRGRPVGYHALLAA